MVLLRLTEKTTGMSENSQNNDKPGSGAGEVTSSFTVDPDESNWNEVPGVTKLLNRKSFVKPAVQTPEQGLLTSIIPSSASETPQLESSGREETPIRPLTVQKPSRRAHQPQPLLSWKVSELRSGSDPLGQAIASLSGLSQALFLAVKPIAQSKTPDFVATAAVNAGSHGAIWEGLHWDPTVFPEIWSQLVNAGFVELPPPGTMTHLQSARNVSRAAFDISNSDTLTIVRAGTPQQWRGIVLLVSRQSLINAMRQASSLFFALPQSKKSA